MGQSQGELELRIDALLPPDQDALTELVAEELMQRVVSVGSFPRYQWNPDNLCCSLDLASGVQLSIAPKEAARTIQATVEWSNRGDRDHKNVKKYLPSAIDGGVSSLQKHRWRILPQTHMRSMEAGFAVEIDVEALADALHDHARTLADVLGRFRF